MPVDYSQYPPNWKTEIRPRILARARNRCELCGAENYSIGYRDKDGNWYDWRYIESSLEKDGIDLFDKGKALFNCVQKDGTVGKAVKIILTIAHWDNPDKMDCRDENLKAACQRCHLVRDLPHHMKNARLTRERKAGLQRLF